ncbi:hypothetical protein V8E53_001084 [Lactarius tabidus]
MSEWLGITDSLNDCHHDQASLLPGSLRTEAIFCHHSTRTNRITRLLDVVLQLLLTFVFFKAISYHITILISSIMHSYKSLVVLAFAVSTASTAYSAPVQYALVF